MNIKPQEGEIIMLKRGFTLVEILVVVVIAGLVLAIIAPQIGDREGIQTRAIQQRLELLQKSIETYKTRTGKYPTLAQMTANSEKLSEKNGWGALIDNELVLFAPFNHLAPDADRHLISATGGKGFGWEYDETTGRLGATYYDEKTGKVTPGTP